MSWPVAFITGLVWLFDVLIFGCTAYAVFWLGFSGWWFLLAFIISSGNRAPTITGETR